MGAKLSLAAVLAAAVVTGTGSAPGSTATSGLYGVVRKGPVRPVCSVGEPCDAPARVTLVFTRRGVETRVRSGADGRYRVTLRPGSYEVRSVERIGLARVPRPHAVHVRAGHRDRIDFLFDTGIR